MKREFILEIGAEDLPPLIVEDMGEKVRNFISGILHGEGIIHDALKLYLTSRRILIHSPGLMDTGLPRRSRVQGPPVKIAFYPDGTPTMAAAGFARKCGVSVDDLKREETEEGEYIYAYIAKPGSKTKEILQQFISRNFKDIHIEKGMRWDEGGFIFPRPVRRVLALFGSELIPMKLAGIESSSFSEGNFVSHPEPFEVKDFVSFSEELGKRGVILDQEKRMERLITLIEEEAGRLGALPVLDNRSSPADDPLLKELNYTVEFPSIGVAGFDEDFLKLPRPILYSVMKKAQRYIPLAGGKGEPLPSFLFVYGNPLADIEEITRNNERVLEARLCDALYFFEEDRKSRLSKRVDDLKGVLFYEGLGTYYDKSKRILALSKWLAGYLQLDEDTVMVSERAGWLSKADLVTKVVGEFPDLQGRMGGEYALLDRERDEVALAISEHYLPVSPEGDLPCSDAGRVVSMADRFDTLAGFFIKGMAPTGAHDPFALRRAALGIIRVLINWRERRGVSLKRMMDRALRLFEGSFEGSFEFDREGIAKGLQAFLNQRMKHLLIEEGHTGDIADAVIEGGEDDPLSIHLRCRALSKLKERGDFSPLMLAFKRVMNIAKGSSTPPLSEELIEEEGEKRLHESFQRIDEEISSFLEKRDYESAFDSILSMKPDIDAFFDTVLVMDPDEKKRNNRLSLLNLISSMILTLANLARVSTQDLKRGESIP